jgi:peptidoglycan/xylan/chitin deacetylase (PgdA/CDA1 family)
VQDLASVAAGRCAANEGSRLVLLQLAGGSPAGGPWCSNAERRATIPSVDDRAAELRARRAARAKEIRRRRRAIGLAALVLVAGLALLAVALSNGSSGGSQPRTTHRAPAAVRRHPRAQGPSFQAQIAAVRRLAAYGLPLFCGGRSKRMVALTFDDGPGVYTNLAIRKLRENHERATFFLVGKEITAFPGLANREKPVSVAGDHTMTHPFLPGLAHAEMVGEIAGAKTLIEHTLGEPVVLFRPPYEGRSPEIEREVKELGLLEVLWNVDSQDSLGANFEGIEHNVIAGLHPGSIIEMHENRGQTIRALPAIFAALARDHLRAVTLPELVAQDPPSLAQLRAGGLGCGVTGALGGEG